MSEKMIFSLGEGKYESKGKGYQKNHRIFNKDVSEKEYSETLQLLRDNEVKISLTHWVDKKDMTEKEKESHSVYKEIGGYLKVFSYEDVWKEWWDNSSQKQKDSITTLKWFDSEIFKEITGIDVKAKSKNPKEIVIDGAKYQLVDE